MPGMIPLPRAAEAAALGDMGYTSPKVAAITGIPQRTAYDIIHGVGTWGKRAELPVFAKLRLEQKQVLQAASLAVSAQALCQVEATILKASAYQAAGIYGLLRTHERLDAGESTSNVSVAHHVEVEDLNEAADRIAHSLLRFSGNAAIDVTPPGGDNSNVR